MDIKKFDKYLVEKRDDILALVDYGLKRKDTAFGIWKLHNYMDEMEEGLKHMVDAYSAGIEWDKNDHNGQFVSIMTKQLNHIKKVQTDFLKIKKFMGKK